MNTEIDIRALPLLARGGQAEIYAFGEGRVLRFPTRPRDFDRIRYEYAVYRMLAGSRVSVPAVYELLEVDGAPAIVMERIDGSSMMDQIRRNPLSAGRRAIELAKLHHQVLGTHAEAPVRETRSNARYCVQASQRLPDELKAEVIRILDKLPDGDCLCHGDFHPGNIICRDRSDYIIDWSGSSKGDCHADVAHSYILLKVVPKTPGVGPFLHLLQRRIGRMIADSYLQTLRSLRSLDERTLSRWVLVKAAERTFYGLPSEQDRLARFVNEYISSLQTGRKEEELYRLL